MRYRGAVNRAADLAYYCGKVVLDNWSITKYCALGKVTIPWIEVQSFRKSEMGYYTVTGTSNKIRIFLLISRPEELAVEIKQRIPVSAAK